MKNIRPFQGKTPKIDESVFVDESAVIIGDVEIGEGGSVWPNTTIRGDMHRIRIGKNTNIQDGSVCHITHAGPFTGEGAPLTIGDNVTVGHLALLHGCTIGNNVLVGMHATVMDHAIIEDDVMIGAHSLVPPKKRLESGFLYAGVPVEKKRPLTDTDRVYLTYAPKNYKYLAKQFMAEETE